MATVTRMLTDERTYRRVLFLLSAVPLGPAWFVALVTVWSLCLGFIITPVVIPLLIGLALMTRALAAIEAPLARALLDADITTPPVLPPRTGGLWARTRALLGASFWRAQGYLMIRAVVGFFVGVAVLALIVSGLALIVAPAWVPFVHEGVHLGFWSPHTFLQSLALVPAGLLLLPIVLIGSSLLATLFAPVAGALLGGGVEPAVEPRESGEGRPREASRTLATHATVDAILILLLVLIWAVTSRGYFWPFWVALPLGVALALHAWFVYLGKHPSVVRRFMGSRALAASAGAGGAAAVFFIAIWAVTGHGYFWPVWPIMAIAVALAVQTAAMMLTSRDQTELTERIETLEHTRAGAVDAQESELKRIERDLHDGAQARLVALGMSLGMAEHNLERDPERAGELLAEARVGAEQALRELRDLARGIHPPVLADRGLAAAVETLADSTPMPVSVSVDIGERPPSTVESAAYFVVAEALANAVKHARAEHVDIRVARVAGTLELDVTDDGVGGANPNGGGLSGLRRRVEALDGSLGVISPPGGPTTVHAELPCG